ncbi:hypothetical protein [Streptomyces sp. RKAG293]|nr:hypothetical protein [Streptomyces sp. RKAG293]
MIEHRRCRPASDIEGGSMRGAVEYTVLQLQGIRNTVIIGTP